MQDSEEKQPEQEEVKVEKDCDCHDCNCQDQEKDYLLQIENLKHQIDELKRNENNRILEFVEKKTKEATEILEQKANDIEQKYKKEFEDKLKYVYESPLSQLSLIVSQFESVIKSITDPTVASYLVGFKMFLSQFEELFQSFGISSIEPELGSEFDSDTMEVSKTKEVSNALEHNKVVSVFSKTYKLHDRVIKLASVEVGKIKE